MWWGAPSVPMGMYSAHHTASTASCHRTFLPPLAPVFLHLLPGLWEVKKSIVQHRLKCRRDMMATAVEAAEVERSRARKTNKQNKGSLPRAGSSSPWSPISGTQYDVCLPSGERQGCQVWGLCIRRGGFPYTPKKPP